MADWSGSSMDCYCGKSFQQLNAFSNHQRHCKSSQERLTSALSKAQQIWLKKRATSRANKQTVQSQQTGSQLATNSEDPPPPAAAAGTQTFSPRSNENSEPSNSQPGSSAPTNQLVGAAGGEAGHPQLENNYPALPSIAERRQRREIRLPARYLDGLPEALEPLPPPEILIGSAAALEMPDQPQPLPPNPDGVTESLPNYFGLFRRFDAGSCPSHDPDSDVTITDLCDIALDDQGPTGERVPEAASNGYGPYPNKSSFLLGEWNWSNDHVQKSNASFKSLINIIKDPDFHPGDVRDTQWDAIDRLLGSSELDPEGPWAEGDAVWTRTPVTISVPFHRYTSSPGPRDYVIPEFYHRSIISILKEAVSSLSETSHFRYAPYSLYWKHSNEAEPVQVYGELYTSPAFIEAHRALQRSPPEPGCILPRIVAGLMLASDATQLTSFGDAKIWPQYLYFGNHSKYHRRRPTHHLCYHVAYFQKLPDSFKDFVLSIADGKNLDSALLTHCNRELLHAQLKIILDDEFLDAYTHGVAIACPDGLRRRFYPRVFTYSADYPEKAILATIRNLGDRPCPRCLIPLSLTHNLGTPEDKEERINCARIDNPSRRDKVLKARKLIYGKPGLSKNTNFGVSSAAVERFLKEHSWVPTDNAFSDRLSSHGFDFFPMLVVDLLHEVEIGVWRSLFIHLLRIMECIGPKLAHTLDARYREVPTFGRDTIRRFSSNCSEMKRFAARDFEDLLQCAIPVFEGLLPDEKNENLLDLLFHLGHWHGLAKLRMHTEPTLRVMDGVTVSLGHGLRDFQAMTCSFYDTRELGREAEARRKRQAATKQHGGEEKGKIPTASDNAPKGGEGLTSGTSVNEATLNSQTSKKRKRPTKNTTSTPKQNSETHTAPTSAQPGRLKKSFNMNTYKVHALGDYTETIRRYGTTDSYSTESGELEHRNPKKWYLRTSRKQVIQQITQIERRQARVRRIRSRLERSHTAVDKGHDGCLSDSEVSSLEPSSARYHIGRSQDNPEHIPSFIQKNTRDPVIKDFLPKLKQHLLRRVQQILSIQPGAQAEFDPSAAAKSQPPIFFKGDRMYNHKTVRFNYTTYDVRRAQDVVNPGTAHCNVMLLASRSDGQTHPFIYARVLGVYHANVIYSGPGMVSYAPRRMDFLWVRWYSHHEAQPERPSRLDQLSFPPVTSDEAVGFVDPADVIRGCHIIPCFNKAKRFPGGTGFSRLARDATDWFAYYVGRFVDRDMLMWYHWGLGVGHKYSWEGSSHPDFGFTPRDPRQMRSTAGSSQQEARLSDKVERASTSNTSMVVDHTVDGSGSQMGISMDVDESQFGPAVGEDPLCDGMVDYEKEDLGSDDDSDTNWYSDD